MYICREIEEAINYQDLDEGRWRGEELQPTTYEPFLWAQVLKKIFCFLTDTTMKPQVKNSLLLSNIQEARPGLQPRALAIIMAKDGITRSCAAPITVQKS
jgi:hypothetical protein